MLRSALALVPAATSALLTLSYQDQTDSCMKTLEAHIYDHGCNASWLPNGSGLICVTNDGEVVLWVSG